MEQDNRAGPHLPGHPRTHTVDRVVLRRFRNHAPLDHLQALARKQCKRLVRTSAVRQAEQRYGFRQLDAAPFRALFRISSRNSSYSACVQRICSNMAFSLIMPKLPCDHP